MKKNTRSILEEISRVVPSYDKNNIVESRANHVITSAINLTRMIYESYDESTAEDLCKRFVNSIKTQDPKKFERGIKKLNESDES
jgi:nitrogenase subunit NifH